MLERVIGGIDHAERKIKRLFHNSRKILAFYASRKIKKTPPFWNIMVHD